MLKVLLATFIALPISADEPGSIVISADERQAIIRKLTEMQGIIDKQAEELNKAKDVANICWSTFPHSIR